MQVIAQGAEAVITRDGNEIVKERIRKSYRIKEIDEKLRKRRTRSEARLIRAARRAGASVPSVTGESEFTLRMEFIEGKKAKDVLDADAEKLGGMIGEAAAKLHTFDIIHGDLTTSNMLLREGKLFLIDFGLGFESRRIEDKAIDLHLFHEALESTHFTAKERAWAAAIEAYSSRFSGAAKVIKALHEIEKRGRYRNRAG